jgi:tRNA-2-methylthio-N6-dimethylallyladenosine synthase
MPFLHLPVQHGADRILKAMNRKHTADDYRDIIARVRAARPDIGLSSDFIVGFPGETEEDFEQTMQLVRDIRFSSCYSFKYSARPGTPAANMGGLVHEAVKDARLQRLQTLLFEQQQEFNNRFIGQTMSVLLDRKGSKNGQMHGRTVYNQSIHIACPEDFYGKILDVVITKATTSSLTGRIP